MKNKLIIIGNGFDLAHGMETDYKSFINYILKKYLLDELVNPNGNFENEFFKYELKFDFPINITDEYNNYLTTFLENCNLKNIEEILIELKNKINSCSNFGDALNLSSLNELFNHFFYQKSIKGWVDFEKEYYRLLIADHKKDRIKNISRVHKDFECIKKEFKAYLQTLDIPKLLDFYEEKIKDYVGSYNQITVLNFNYTNILDTEKLRTIANQFKSNINYEVINIHGSLNSGNLLYSPYQDDIIFGYGDEMDDSYKLLEKSDYPELLKNIKSFHYGLSSNYHKIVSFIESLEYDVDIWGHSCGLSDRTLLSYLFQHKHCEKIKIWHYNYNDEIRKDKTPNNNFIEIYQNISRNFIDKIEMRKKVISYSFDSYMRQINRRY